MKLVTRASYGDRIDWTRIVDAIAAGHRMPPAQIEDVFLGPPGRTLLSRAAWIEGLGYGVKSVTVMAENTSRGLPTVQGAMLVFEDRAGALRELCGHVAREQARRLDDNGLAGVEDLPAWFFDVTLVLVVAASLVNLALALTLVISSMLNPPFSGRMPI